MKQTSPSLSERVKPRSWSTLISHGARDIKWFSYYKLKEVWRTFALGCEHS